MRGQKARSVFNATENICKMVKLSTSLNFVYHLARAKAPEIVHPCPYIVSEQEMFLSFVSILFCLRTKPTSQ